MQGLVACCESCLGLASKVRPSLPHSAPWRAAAPEIASAEERSRNRGHEDRGSSSGRSRRPSPACLDRAYPCRTATTKASRKTTAIIISHGGGGCSIRYRSEISNGSAVHRTAKAGQSSSGIGTGRSYRSWFNVEVFDPNDGDIVSRRFAPAAAMYRDAVSKPSAQASCRKICGGP